MDISIERRENLIYLIYFATQRSSIFDGQSGLVNFTITVNGEKCKALEKRVSLQLEDESVFSAVVGIENNEVILNKV